ncbi:hypothetical protein FPANT_7478 [Fusarium pseudoanthophilum]|uniref:Uncharacterized protein n=1 Tax=Fusarium pseudoanthophilum TaxID=48495 RepID=A0A8H5NZS1_9HYPO|nr:hypothetical protein FPANT_7478 [Fusarium pseudoanthophilum]
MSPTIRFLSSYNLAVLPRLSIFQQRDEEGLDSVPESEQVEDKTELGLESNDEESDEDDDPDEGFPVSIPSHGGDDTKNDHTDNGAVLKKVCGQPTRPRGLRRPLS